MTIYRSHSTKRRLWMALIAFMAIAAIGPVNAIRHATPVHAAPGSVLRTITVTPAPTCSPLVSVGIAFDGTELLVSCWTNNEVTRVNPLTGANLGKYTIAGLNGIPAGVPGSDNAIGAMSWDASVPGGQLWLATANGSHNIYRVPGATLNKTLGLGVATPAFHHALGGQQIIDGLSFDGTDSTIWMSPDVSDTIYHYTEAGVLLGSVSGLTAKLGGFGNSGIAVANATTIYLANDGGSQIYSADKPAIATTTLFATVSPFRLEGLACDSTNFTPLAAIWSKDAYDYILRAFEVPAGQCAQGGVVGPPPCPENDENGNAKDDNSKNHAAGNKDMNVNVDMDDNQQCEEKDQEEGGDNGDEDQPKIHEHDNRDGGDFNASRIDSVQFSQLGKKETVSGLGLHNGQAVSFVMVVIDNGTTAPGFFSLVLSDGYNVVGSLVDGSVALN